jgi:tetratricopeptide (TPR) repeat protein
MTQPDKPSAPDAPLTDEQLDDNLARWMRGEVTLRELYGLSEPEMGSLSQVGYTLYTKGQYQEATAIFRGLAVIDPGEAYYRLALGTMCLEQDDFEAAEVWLNEAVRLDGKALAAYVNRGELYLRKGMVVEGAQDLARAVELDPEGKDPLTGRARALAAAALEQIEALQAGNEPTTARKK